MKFKLQ